MHRIEDEENPVLYFNMQENSKGFNLLLVIPVKLEYYTDATFNHRQIVRQ